MSLYSERMGRQRHYTSMQLYNAISSQLRSWDVEQLLLKATGGKIYFDDKDSEGGTKEFYVNGNLDNPGAFFRRKLVHDMSFRFWNAGEFLANLPPDLSPIAASDLYLFFDFLEILHELAAYPTMSDKTKKISYSAKEGRRLFRESINPDLALHKAPHQMLSNGQIVEVSNKPVIELAEQALQIIELDGVTDSVVRPVNSAVTNYIKRGATPDEKKAAVRELADALESIRSSVKTHLLSADENELFKIANQFSIRHNDSKQKSDYDESIWYDWMFHVNLAALLTVIRILREQA